MKGCGPGAGLWAGLGAQGSAQAHLTGLPCLGEGRGPAGQRRLPGVPELPESPPGAPMGAQGGRMAGCRRLQAAEHLCTILRSSPLRAAPAGVLLCPHAGPWGSRASAPAVSPRGVFFLLSPQVAANAYLSQGRLQGWLHLQPRACTWEEK